MEFRSVIESAGTCRYYRPDPVPLDVLRRVLDAARFAPSGGNRQPVRFVVTRDAATKATLQSWYLARWSVYNASYRDTIRKAGGRVPKLYEGADHFAHHLAAVPALVTVCAKLADVHPSDAALGRLSVVGGASIYPAVQNLLLAARAEGLGAALTTILCADEPRVKALLAIPEEFATVAMLALGFPERPFPKRLSRRPIEELVFGERFGDPLA